MAVWPGKIDARARYKDHTENENVISEIEKRNPAEKTQRNNYNVLLFPGHSTPSRKSFILAS
jgi:hypothetical protein